MVFALILLFGCAGQAPQIQPANNSSLLLPQAAPQGESQEFAARQQPPKENATGKQAQPTPQPRQPPKEAASAHLRAGSSLNFSEGAIRLLDVWAESESLPAKLSVSDLQRRNYSEFQLVAGQAKKFVAPSGRQFWIYAKSTDAGAASGAKRAHIFVFEAKEKGEAFEESLYGDALGGAAASLPASQAFLWKASSSILNRSSVLRAGSLSVELEDLRAYPKPPSVAMVKIWDGYSEPQYASIPLGHAYLFASPYRSKYFIYNAASGLSRSGEPKSELHVFAASGAAEGGSRLYRIDDFDSPPSQQSLVGKFNLRMGQPVSVARDFYMRHTYLRLLDCSPGSKGFALASAQDDQFLEVSEGMMSPGHPLRFKDKFNRTYSAWLESLACASGEATVSVYKD
ncbi:MAG: hypothetical protein N3F07_01320 [Candidatus Micrarchaeota archaeon]|nr:hypothetical protein [Candidatus Micrarchaeota archaeon]